MHRSSPRDDFLGASPDALIDDDEILEIKCPFGLRNAEDPQFKRLEDQPHYYAQVQIEMFCSGRHTTNFMQWNPRTYHVQRVQIDPAWVGACMPTLYKIYHEEFLAIRDQPVDMPECPESLSYAAALTAKEVADAKYDAAKAALIRLARGDKTGLGYLRYQN